MNNNGLKEMVCMADDERKKDEFKKKIMDNNKKAKLILKANKAIASQ